MPDRNDLPLANDADTSTALLGDGARDMPLRRLPAAGHTYLVDFDSTINDFGQRFIEVINQNFGTSFRYQDSKLWDFFTNFEPMGMTREMESFGWKTWDSKGFTMELQPLPGAVHAVHRMIDSGARVIVLSSRPQHHGQWLRDWLDDKGLKGAEAWVTPMKLEFAQEYAVSLAFDDSPHHAVSLSAHCPVYLMDRPWNQEVNGANITRVPSLWLAVEDMGID